VENEKSRGIGGRDQIWREPKRGGIRWGVVVAKRITRRRKRERKKINKKK
jgi:hypothetical protein